MAPQKAKLQFVLPKRTRRCKEKTQGSLTQQFLISIL